MTAPQPLLACAPHGGRGRRRGWVRTAAAWSRRPTLWLMLAILGLLALSRLRPDLAETEPTGFSSSGPPTAYGATSAPQSGAHRVRSAERWRAGALERGDEVLSELAAAETLDDPDARLTAWQALVGRLSHDEARRLLELVETRQSLPDASEVAALLRQGLAATDPVGFEAWARARAEGESRAAAFATLAVTLCETDGRRALEWARGLDWVSSPSEANAVLQVASELARTEPAAALDLAAALPVSAQRDECLAHCVAQWAVRESAAAVAWATEIEDLALRQQMVAQVVTALAEEEPHAAAEWTATALPPGTVQARAAVAVAQRWSKTEPESARAWITAFPDDQLRRDAWAAVEQATVPSEPPVREAAD